MRFCPILIRGRGTTVLVKQVCRVLVAAEVGTSLVAEAVASALFSNHSLVAVRLGSSEDPLVLLGDKTLKSLPIFHLNKRSLVPTLP